MDYSKNYDQETAYKAPKYENVYIPKFTQYRKDNVPGYKFIESVEIGKRSGHIIFGNGEYYLCLRRGDGISYYDRLKEPMGFRRDTIEELRAIADSLRDAIKREIMEKNWGKPYLIKRKKYRLVSKVPNYNLEKPWHIRMAPYKLVNLYTREVLQLGDHQEKTARYISVNNNVFKTIISKGIEANGWCLMTERLDGQSWEKVLEKKKHYKSRVDFFACSFFNKVTGETVPFISCRKTSPRLKVTHERLRQALINHDGTINGFMIIRKG